MTFFNKKEDVMKIELTPHGRHLLSKGIFNPEFYAFFDDDIIYDYQVVGITEENTQIKERILSNTPSLRPQVTHKGVESSLYDQKTVEDDNVLPNPIGTNKIISKNANSWNVTAILGEFTSSLNYISSSTSPLYNIPQVECELNFTMSVAHFDDVDYFDDDYVSSEIAEDDTFLRIKKEKLLLYILEKNGFSYRDSLSVEVFQYDHDEVYMNKLSFQNDFIDTESDEVIDNDGVSIDDPRIINTYFNLVTDRAISEIDLCKGLTKLKDVNIYLGLNIDCEDFQPQEVNIYQTNVTDYEDCE